MSFIMQALEPARFEPLFELEPDELERLDARRCIADSAPGYPCRVSLRDAAPGEELLLCNFRHQDGDGPYRASGPIFVRRHAKRAELEPGRVPDMLRARVLSVRAYDERHEMIAAEVADGRRVEDAINHLFDGSAASYLHIHFAGRGCYACRVIRDGGSDVPAPSAP